MEDIGIVGKSDAIRPSRLPYFSTSPQKPKETSSKYTIKVFSKPIAQPCHQLFRLHTISAPRHGFFRF
jgi:hypothetical protein